MVYLGVKGSRGLRFKVLRGSGDLVSRVITKVTIVISTYNLNWGTYNPTY